MNTLFSYRIKKILIPVLAVFFFVFGLMVDDNAPNRQTYFPFYTHKLFHFVHTTVIDYGIIIYGLNGNNVEVDIMELADKNFSVKNMAPYWAIQGLGDALRKIDSDPGEIKANFEQRYFGPYRSVEYEVIRRSWDPLKAWKERPKFSYYKTEVVGRYRYP